MVTQRPAWLPLAILLQLADAFLFSKKRMSSFLMVLLVIFAATSFAQWRAILHSGDRRNFIGSSLVAGAPILRCTGDL